MLDHFKIVKSTSDGAEMHHFKLSTHAGEWDHFQYSYCGSVILIGFVVNLIVIGRTVYDRRKRSSGRRSSNYTIIENGFSLPFTILTCFVATSNLLLILTRDLGHLLEASTSGDWRSTDFVCKLYKFSTFLSLHLCSYSVLALVACAFWYVCRRTPKQNRIGLIVAVCWALAVAFCAPLYHVAGLSAGGEDERTGGKITLCHTLRPRDQANTDLIFASYPYFLVVTVLIAPTVAVLLCYLFWGRKILAQRRFVDIALSPVQLVRQTREHGKDEVDGFSSDDSPSTGRVHRPVPSKPERRSTESGKIEHAPLAPNLQIQTDMAASVISSYQQISPKWKTCRIAALVSLTYVVCWIPYAIVFLLVARGDIDPATVSITVPTYMLFLLYPVVSGVCLML